MSKSSRGRGVARVSEPGQVNTYPLKKQQQKNMPFMVGFDSSDLSSDPIK